MGVGYSASALHHIAYSEPDPDSTWRDPPPGFMELFPGAVRNGRATRFRSPAPVEIVAWRDRVSAKYRTQLGEDLVWDEDDSFTDSEDVATSADVLLRYVAAVLDERGEKAAAGALLRTTKPPRDQMTPVLAAACQRGMTSSFPHLLLGGRCWLPFAQNAIIQEPDWNGSATRFGSASHLSAELDAVRAFIAATAPAATEWTARRQDPPPNVLASAWQASDTIARLCTVALARRLPLWSTG
jgi:hypothetical protein